MAHMVNRWVSSRYMGIPLGPKYNTIYLHAPFGNPLNKDTRDGA